MSQQPVSESVLTNHYRCATVAHVSRRFSGQVEIVPGVVGTEQIIDPRPALLAPDGSVDIQLDIRFDPRQCRYVCHEVRATTARRCDCGSAERSTDRPLDRSCLAYD